MPPTDSHVWQFFRAGGVDQVLLRDAADLAHLPELDLKLWMALSMPTRGIEIDPRTADLIDSDADGHLRPPEILEAVAWSGRIFKDLGAVIRGGASVGLDSIRDAETLANARALTARLGKAEATSLGLAEIEAGTKLLASPDDESAQVAAWGADYPAIRRLLLETEVQGATGTPSLDPKRLEAFLSQASTWCTWAAQPGANPALLPLGEETAKASAAVAAAESKVDDYFARCRLAAFDPRAQAALNGDEKEFTAIAARVLTATSAEIAALPLAPVQPERALPLDSRVNPAWSERWSTLVEAAVKPILGASPGPLTEAAWGGLKARFAPYRAWQKEQPSARWATLGLPRLRELLAEPGRAQLSSMVQREVARVESLGHLQALERMVRYQRDLYRVLTNFVSFAEFYGRSGAVFQSGTLFLDGRSCDLCLEVIDPGRNATLAQLSSAYLAYCELSRPGAPKRTIVAAFTNGDADNLMVGRNGVFYDRQGRDWDATITRVVSNPISVREAFFTPYKKLVRFIEEQITKRAQSAEADSTSSLNRVAGQVAQPAPPADPAKPAAPPAKLDLGTIALVGTAIGGVSALVGGFLSSLFGLGVWMPLGVVGLVLLISGPSMLLAALKLRQRNLGPLLDANGWAINTRSKLNIPFGAALTRLPHLPPGSSRNFTDPFAERRRPWRLYALVVCLAALAGAWFIGRLDPWLPPAARSSTVLSRGMAPR